MLPPRFFLPVYVPFFFFFFFFFCSLSHFLSTPVPCCPFSLSHASCLNPAVYTQRYIPAIDGKDYLPGIKGLNNIKHTDWFNAVAQSLLRVKPLRAFFLLGGSSAVDRSRLLSTFAELTAKVWSNRTFRGHISPHEVLQAVSKLSEKKFRIGHLSDPIKFLAWFLHQFNMAMMEERKDKIKALKAAGKKEEARKLKKKPTIVEETFQGEVEVTTRTPVLSAEAKRKTATLEELKVLDAEKANGSKEEEEEEGSFTEKSETKKFLYLSLSLPPVPLFKETQDKSLIPQVSLFELLAKFDGSREEKLPDGSTRTYRITRLPQYLVVHFQRFQNNNWFIEKNSTLVNFPIKNLNLKRYVKESTGPSEEELYAKPVKELKDMLTSLGGDAVKCLTKGDLVDSIMQQHDTCAAGTKFDLISNIVHEGEAKEGSYKYVLCGVWCGVVCGVVYVFCLCLYLPFPLFLTFSPSLSLFSHILSSALLTVSLPLDRTCLALLQVTRLSRANQRLVRTPGPKHHNFQDNGRTGCPLRVLHPDLRTTGPEARRRWSEDGDGVSRQVRRLWK